METASIASRVFAPMLPSRFDTGTRMWLPMMNIDPAKKFGDVVICLPPESNRLTTAPLVAALREKLADFTENDWLVAIGDPSLIAAAAVITARKTNGLLRLLKWDRMASDYLPTEIRL